MVGGEVGCSGALHPGAGIKKKREELKTTNIYLCASRYVASMLEPRVGQ
jgi:hypothetical protein